MSKRLTLADLCLICAKRGVGIRIFVQDEHLSSEPAQVTIQVISRVRGVQPRAFITFVLEGDPQIEEVLADELRRYVDMVSSGLVLVAPRIIGMA